MGHKVSIMTDMTHTGACSLRHRQLGLSLLAVTLAATTVGTNAFQTVPCFASAAPPSFSSSSSFRRNHRFMTPASTSSTLEISTAQSMADTSSFFQGPDEISFVATWKRRLLLHRKQKDQQERKRKQRDKDQDSERRKQEWAARYTSVDALRHTFGENRNKLWGDLDASTSRRLYKTLLPRALLELYKLGLHPEDLAPLAYQARVAAKLYSRERCCVPGRVLAMGYDGFRQWQRYGKFQPMGMSYDQVWDKYEALILGEEDADGLTERDVTAKICLKILERSCQTNESIDKLFLREPDSKLMMEQQQDIATVTNQLERDVRAILEPDTKESTKSKSLSAQRVFTLRLVARAKKRLEGLKREDMKGQSNNVTLSLPDGTMRPWNERTRKTDNRARTWQDRTPPPRNH